MYEQDGIRGAIKYPERYKQLISYAGLERMRKITPTDIDGLIDYGGKAFVYLECKKTGKGLDYGQRLALENLVMSHEKAGHSACVILFTHENPAHEIIMAKDKIVKMVFRKRKSGFAWLDVSEDGITVLAAIDSWEKFCKLK